MADVDRADLTYAYSRPFARHCATHDSFGFLLPIVLGLGEDEAAAAIGISVSKFRTLVKDKRMPRPRRIDGRAIWDVDELRIAFKALPHEGDRDGTDSWADVV